MKPFENATCLTRLVYNEQRHESVWGTGACRLNGLFYRALRFAIRAVARALFGLSVVGSERLPQAGSAVLVANHVSWLDPIILALALTRKPTFLAMQELWRMPSVRLVMRAWRLAIPVHRGAVDTAALRRGLRALKNGALLIVFPEGGISTDGRLRPFHRGAALLAARAQVPLVPIAIIGTADALPLGRVIPRPRPVTVRIGTPIPAPGPTRDDLLRASDQAASQIRGLLEAAPRER